MPTFHTGLWFLGAVSVAIAEPIEQPDSDGLNRLYNAEELAILKAGSPIPMRTSSLITIGATSRKALVRPEGADRQSIELRGCTVSFRWNAADRIRDIEPRFSLVEGTMLIRDSDGRVAQAWSDVGVIDITRQPDGMELTLWDMQDTEYGGAIPGSRKGVEGRTPLVVQSIREIARDPAKGMLEVLTTRRRRDGSSSATRSVLNNGLKRSQLVTEDYSNAEPIAANLTSRETIQRIFWKEGPGVRDLVRRHQRDPDGTMQLVEDTDTCMKVDENGRRKVAEETDKLQKK